MTIAFAPALVGVGAQTVFAADTATPLTIPKVRRDRLPPVILAGSLFVHAAAFLPLFLGGQQRPTAPPEVEVELVQAPTAKREPAKPVAAKPAPAKPMAPGAAVSEKPAPNAAHTQKRPPRAARSASAPKPSQPLPTPRREFKPVATRAPENPSTAERLRELLGPMPAQALPGASESGTDVVSYSQLVLSKVAKAKKEGRYTGIPGYSTVAFTIGDHGEVQSAQIRRNSGDPSLDEEAIAMVKRAAPYPAPPPGGQRDYVITLRFQALP